MRDPEAIVAYRAANSVEARALVMHLEDSGISAHIVGEPLYDAYAGLNFTGVAPIEVWIAPTDKEVAKPVIDAWRAEFRSTVETARDSSTRFKFSLLSLLILMTLVALLAWVARYGPEVFSNTIAVALWVLEFFLVCYFFKRRKSLRESMGDSGD
jgi:hypothetical protein